MANTLITSSYVAKEMVRQLKGKLGLYNAVTKKYNSEWAGGGGKYGKPGTTFNIRKAPRFIANTTVAGSLTDYVDEIVPFVVDKSANVLIGFNSNELALSFEDFGNRFVSPAAAALANQIDVTGVELVKTFHRYVGTPGTAVSSLQTVRDANAKITQAGGYTYDKRYLVADPTFMATATGLGQSLFNPSGAIGEQYRTAQMREALGFKWAEDFNMSTHTTGNFGTGQPLVNGAAQTGSSIVTDGWQASVATLKAGDIISFANVFRINPQSRVASTDLMTFVVTADATSTAGGAITMAISPAIVTSGPLQNVSAGPADNAQIRVWGQLQAGFAAISNLTVQQSFAFEEEALTCAIVELDHLAGAEGSTFTDPESGISVRVTIQGDVTTNQNYFRVDALYGWVKIHSDLGIRIITS